MFGWLRRWLSPASAGPIAQQPPAQPFRWPGEVSQLASLAEVEATLRRERAVVFISVEWSEQERHSRRTFAEFVGRIVREHSELGLWFGVISESSEGIGRLFEVLALPTSAATGYGAVVWLQHRRVVALVPYAAEVGPEGLVNRTLQLWVNAESGFSEL
jgi:hypothetical protein